MDEQPFPDNDYIATNIAEAANQGIDGMHAVSNVIRNRGMSLQGFSGYNRVKKFGGADAYLAAQPRWIVDRATRAWKESADRDITNGATHFENVEAFGLPRWARDMDTTAKIGAHTFFREKKI